jgi:hypothetical protein
MHLLLYGDPPTNPTPTSAARLSSFLGDDTNWGSYHESHNSLREEKLKHVFDREKSGRGLDQADRLVIGVATRDRLSLKP